MKHRFALDSSILGNLATRQPSGQVLARLGEHARECAIPAPAWAELLAGARGLPEPQRGAFESFLWDVLFRCFAVLPYDRAAAEWHAVEADRAAREGRRLSFIDGAIASIAVVNNLSLVTLEPDFYLGFGGLRTAAWIPPTPVILAESLSETFPVPDPGLLDSDPLGRVDEQDDDARGDFSSQDRPFRPLEHLELSALEADEGEPVPSVDESPAWVVGLDLENPDATEDELTTPRKTE